MSWLDFVRLLQTSLHARFVLLLACSLASHCSVDVFFTRSHLHMNALAVSRILNEKKTQLVVVNVVRNVHFNRAYILQVTLVYKEVACHTE